MNCPKCGFPRQPESNECPKCGIIYDKYGKNIRSRQAEGGQTEGVREVRAEKKKGKKEVIQLFFKKLSIKKRISQLNSFQKSGLILLAVLLFIGIGFMIFRPDITVTGNIFITKKGESKINLGSAEVIVFPMDTLVPYLLKRKDDRYKQLLTILKKIEAARIEYDAALKNAENVFRWDFDNADQAIKARESAERKWQTLRSEETEISSSGFFFQELPSPLLSTKTNSEGEFTVLIPRPDLHVITASARRQVADKVEKYYWITPIDPENGSRQAVTLSADNLLSPDDIEAFVDKYSHELP